jgi:broad specificity phosphatase PhoE
MSPNNLEPIIPWCDTSTKRVLLLRHGQAVHNPRAEAARENGCPFDEFLSLMREDDAFDSPLTELGEHQAIQVGRQLQQALHNIDMIVSSPLSRALRTADLVLPPSGLPASSNAPRRVCVEELREINGSFLNAKRRPRSELEHRFPHWNFGHIPGEFYVIDLLPVRPLVSPFV